SSVVVDGLSVALSNAQAREKLSSAERLGDIVIRASVEGVYLFIFVIANGDHEDRDMAPFAQPFEHGGAVHVRQSQIEQDSIGVAPRRFINAIPARGCFEYFV